MWRPLTVALRALGVVEVQAMLWAGLEGARLQRRSEEGCVDDAESADRIRRARPFTIDEAGEIIRAASAAPQPRRRS